MGAVAGSWRWRCEEAEPYCNDVVAQGLTIEKMLTEKLIVSHGKDLARKQYGMSARM